MRKALVIVFLLNVALILATTALLPARVALHFGPGGQADNWAPSWVNAVLFIGVSALLFAMFYWTPALVRKTPPDLLSLPNKDYWLRPENRETMLKMIGDLMAEFGIAMLVFFGWVEVLTTVANMGETARLNEALFYPGLILFLLYTGVWTYRLFAAFRLPPGEKGTLSSR